MIFFFPFNQKNKINLIIIFQIEIGGKMALDMIKKIKNSEIEGEQIISDAQIKAKKIISETEENFNKKEKELLLSSKKRMSVALERAGKDAEVIVKDKKEESLAERKSNQENSKKNLQEAFELTINKLEIEI